MFEHKISFKKRKLFWKMCVCELSKMTKHKNLFLTKHFSYKKKKNVFVQKEKNVFRKIKK
jgi:hypothetical protein